VDNLAHSLCGALLARCGLDRRGPWVLPALVVAANLPDVEKLAHCWRGKAGYLLDQRGLTHGVLGLAVQSLVLAAAVCAICRRSTSRPRFGSALAVSAIGLASHLTLDWLNPYGVRPWLPFSDRWVYGDVAFIVDPWMWLVLGGGVWLAAPRRPAVRRLALFLAAGVLTIVAAAVLAGIAPPLVLVAASAIVAGLALARRRWRLESRAALVSSIAAAALLVYVFALFVLSRAATACALDAAAMTGARTATSPAPGVPWRFTVALSDGVEARGYRVDLASGAVDLAGRAPTGLGDPRLATLRDSLELDAWRAFARLPMVEFRDGEAILEDARFHFDRTDWTALRVPLPRR
jgi:membrane-bound metal-dependent hydrolase YbcI (DUF457 family)